MHGWGSATRPSRIGSESAAVVCAVMLVSSAVAAADLTAGAAKKAITPKQPGQYLAGLNANRRATGVHDDIWARCLALSDGSTTIAILSLDLIGLLPGQVDAIRSGVPDLPASNFIVASTHVHSAPDTIGLWGLPGRSGVDPGYAKYVQSQASAAVNEALKQMRSARLRVARAEAPPRTSVNVRDEGLIDREVSVLQAVDEQDKGIGTLVNWACHPETLWNDNTLVTADFPNYLCTTVEKAVGGIAVYVNGALGGMVTVDVGDEHTFAEAERIGTRVGRAVVAALKDGETVADVGIRLAAADVVLPIENPRFESAAAAGLIPLSALDDVVTQIYAIGLGPAQMVTVPGEALPGVGASIKQLMPGPYRFLVGLCPIELGYILPADAYDAELYEYERSMSVGGQTAPILTGKIRELVEGL